MADMTGIEPAPYTSTVCRSTIKLHVRGSRGRNRTYTETVNSRLHYHYATLECK